MTGNNGMYRTADRMGFMTGRTDKHGRRVHAAAVLSDKDGRAAMDGPSNAEMRCARGTAVESLHQLHIQVHDQLYRPATGWPVGTAPCEARHIQGHAHGPGRLHGRTAASGTFARDA